MQNVFRGSVCTTIFSIAAALTVAYPSNLVAQATKTNDSIKISREALAKMTPRSGQHLPKQPGRNLKECATL